MFKILAVFIGGGMGSVLRYGISILFQDFNSRFPIGTVITNLLSCLLIGIIIYTFSDKIVSSTTLKLFLVIGFCGGFSTFSTFSLESFELLKNQAYFFFVLNLIVSVLLGIGIIAFLSKQI